MNKSQIREKQYIKMIRNTSDRFHNLMQVFINNQEGHMMESNEFDNDKYTTQFIKQSITETNFSVTAEIITLFGYFTSVLYIVNKSIQKKFSHKEIVPLILILGNLNTYILLNTSGIAHFLFARIGSLNESTDFLEALLFQQSSRQFDSVINKGRIQFKDVSFRYNDTTTNVINNVSFTVKPGEKVAIIGQSGSGKSTLMKMLVGLYKPTSGVIYVDGFNINKITHQHLRDKIVYINQHTVLFDDTVASNIQYGNNTSVAEIQQILKKYKLDTIYENLPNGIHTKAGVNGLNLSHGMQKVTIILRGLLKPSSVIILDEPLAGLDSNTRQKVLRLIMDYTENKTTVVITHDKEILPFMDHTITPTSQKKAIETSPFTNQLFE
jgi:ATP-binding cassette subfamily B protein